MCQSGSGPRGVERVRGQGNKRELERHSPEAQGVLGKPPHRQVRADQAHAGGLRPLQGLFPSLPWWWLGKKAMGRTALTAGAPKWSTPTQVGRRPVAPGWGRRVPEAGFGAKPPNILPTTTPASSTTMALVL